MENRDVGQSVNMAEAAVESPAARFFCHRCTQEINPVLPDYICPRCLSGFIEELAQGPAEQSENSDEDFSPLTQIADLWSMLSYMRNPDDPFHNTAQESRDGRTRPGPSRRARQSRIPTRRTDDPMRARNEGFRSLAQPNSNPLFLQQLISTLSENAGFVTNTGVPIFLNLHSNPEDYAWGRGGWNAIINQLINQLDVTGPPPLPKEQINEIPIVEITQDLVDKNLQCTVCMEDFKLNEPVRRLSCEHNFHNDCIIPWLELHGTCPICRKLLNENSQESVRSPEITEAFMVDAGLMESSSSPIPASIAEELESSTNRNFASHVPPSVYDFNEDFD